MEPASMRNAGSVRDSFDDTRPEVLAQRQTVDLANAGPRMEQQRVAANAIQHPVGDGPSAPNRTGLPDDLKAGIESLSGISMDDVKVHYNSAQPSQLHAHAYAQGSAIHLAPGQDRHLPHEAWHVVQQKQGRVKPTMQLKGTTIINDDVGLEVEADVMGARAREFGRQAPVQRAAIALGTPPGQPVAQMWVAPEIGNLNSDFNKARASGDYGELDWITTTWSAYETIEDAQGMVEEASDKELLNRLEGELDVLVNAGNALIVSFNDARYEDRVNIATEITKNRKRILRVVGELDAKFRPAEGGFGAAGRATEVNGRQVVKGARGGEAHLEDRFIADTTLNGAAMTATHKVTGSPDHAHEAGPINVLVAGFNRVAVEREGKDEVKQIIEKITKPAVQGKEATAKFIALARGDGQAAAMGGTNARGYAWLHDIDGWDKTRWEWLHLRGAGLGGATAGSNLVLGTRDANTQMIPFEFNMRELDKVARDSGNYTGVEASWKPNDEVRRHAYRDIKMVWKAPRTGRGVTEGAEEIYGQVDIHPLRVGAVLSKAEVRHIEQALKTVREKINAQKADMVTE